MTPRTKKGGLIVLALLGLLLLVMGLKKGNGSGTSATPSGSIGSVDVAQGWAAHLIPKSVGDIVTIAITYSTATKNSLGQPIPWNYGISWRYKHPPTGELRAGGFFNIGSRPNGTFSFGASDTLDSSFFPGNWRVEVALHADNSSATGQPLNDMPALEDNALVLATATHPNAFQVM